MPSDPFHPARLVARVQVGGGLSLVTVEPAPAVAATYASPGQYVEVRADSATGFFVLANEPGDPKWELLMRAGGGASDVLLAMPLGAAIETTIALGEGFPMHVAAGRPLVVALGGTGIAAGRPLVRRRAADGDAALTRVLVGLRTRSEVPRPTELRAWSEAGVQVVVCLSQDDGAEDGLQYVRGHVQDALRSQVGPRALSAACIFAVGPASMLEALRDVAGELGIDRSDVYTNH